MAMCPHQVRPYVADMQYDIQVEGHLERRWSAWFDHSSLIHREDGTTVIRCTVTDQAALHGVLQKLRDIGLTLISITPAAAPAPLGGTPAR